MTELYQQPTARRRSERTQTVSAEACMLLVAAEAVRIPLRARVAVNEIYIEIPRTVCKYRDLLASRSRL